MDQQYLSSYLKRNDPIRLLKDQRDCHTDKLILPIFRPLAYAAVSCYYLFVMGNNLSFWQLVLVYFLSIWSLVWKGIALWRAAKHSQRNWFIVILVLNTIGLLEILYLFRFCKKRMTVEEVKHGLQKLLYTRSKST